MPLGRRFARTSFIHKHSRDNDSRAEHNCWHGTRLSWHSQPSQWHQNSDNTRVTVEDEGSVHPVCHSFGGQMGTISSMPAAPHLLQWLWVVTALSPKDIWSAQSWSCLCSTSLLCPESPGEGLKVNLALLLLSRAPKPPWAPAAVPGAREMGKAIKGHEGAAIPWCWMSPTSRAARDQHHGLPQDINTCPSHGTTGAAARMGMAKAALDGHCQSSCQSPQGTEHPEGAKLEPPDPGAAPTGPSVPRMVPPPWAGGWRDRPRLAGALLS